MDSDTREYEADDSTDYKYSEEELNSLQDYRYDEIRDISASGEKYCMRVCIVAEGCYPYVVGGVSSWIHSLIQSFSNIEFILLAIVANRTMRGRFVYELPENLTEVYEVYLEDVDWVRKRKEGRSLLKLSDREYRALRCLILNQYIDWSVLFQMFRAKEISLNDLLMGEDFYRAVRDCYDLQFSQIVFSDFLWTMRSAVVFGAENGCAKGGFVSLRGYRICRCDRVYGKRSPWQPDTDLGTWYLYEGAGRGTDQGEMGQGYL